MFTDGDPAMAAAIRSALPNTSHLLYTYHLSKNIYTHIKPLFNHKAGNAKEMWEKFCNCWWKICKKQDAKSCISFDAEWHDLLGILESIEHNTDVKTLESAKKWLQSLYERKKQWVSRWTWNHLTLGVHSTQRSESIHAAIKLFLSSHTLLTDLAGKLEEYRHNISERGEGKATRLALKQFSRVSGQHPIEDYISKRISPFAMSIVKSQIALCMQYTVEELLGDDRNTDSREIFSCKRTLTNEHVDSPIDLDLQDSPTPVLSYHIYACDLSLPSEITTSSETLRRVSLSSCTCLSPLVGDYRVGISYVYICIRT